MAHGGVQRGASHAHTRAHTRARRRVFREETFGPLVPLFRFSSDDEAVALANDTEYGARPRLLGCFRA